MGTVTGLVVYPVKSLRRVDVGEAYAEQRGLRGDRRWMLTNPDGRFLTQRDHGVLATVRTVLREGGLTLQASGRPDLEVDEPTGPTRTVVVWGSEVQARDAGDDAAIWLTEVVGMPARLVHMPESSVRPIHPDHSRPGDHVSFADGFPLLLANGASLDDLNSRLVEPVPMQRFRPNIVVTGFPALAEDGWKRVRIGEVTFRAPKLCGRCVVTTTDQETGERRGDEPLKTLTQYRLVGQAAIFGINLIPDSEGPIRVGDPVDVLD